MNSHRGNIFSKEDKEKQMVYSKPNPGRIKRASLNDNGTMPTV